MDPQYNHEPMNTGYGADEAMGGVDENMSTTPTGYQNGQQPRRQSTTEHNGSNPPYSPSPEDPNARYPSNPSYQQQPQPYSRPSSGLSGPAYSQTYQEQNQRSAQGSEKAQSSVVIKVGMVGDAQIGKTSLMVKYVEGSWDEDYIQTLGTDLRSLSMDTS